MKTMVLATPDKRIRYVSHAYRGSCHDFSILKAELPPEHGNWFAEKSVRVDLGYYGIQKLYRCLELHIPDKKPKGKVLTKKQKESNREKSKIRIYVENAIGGMKRYRFLTDRLRCHRIDFYNKVVGIAAGLWNYILTC